MRLRGTPERRPTLALNLHASKRPVVCLSPSSSRCCRHPPWSPWSPKQRLSSTHWPRTALHVSLDTCVPISLRVISGRAGLA